MCPEHVDETIDQGSPHDVGRIPEQAVHAAIVPGSRSLQIVLQQVICR
jgi:hypothetical protein